MTLLMLLGARSPEFTVVALVGLGCMSSCNRVIVTGVIDTIASIYRREICGNLENLHRRESLPERNQDFRRAASK